MANLNHQAAKPMNLRMCDRVQQALDLRTAGASYANIAKRMSISKGTAYNLVMRGLSELKAKTAEIAERARAVELLRLDALLFKLWPQRSNPRVTDSILRTMERRAKLLGLDAPQKVAETDAQGNDAPKAARAILYAKLLQ